VTRTPGYRPPWNNTKPRSRATPPACWAIDGHAAEWLFTVCRHRALDVARKENRMKRFGEGEVERVTASDPRPGRALEAEETHAALLMPGVIARNSSASCAWRRRWRIKQF
jgi:hypothetical protein